MVSGHTHIRVGIYREKANGLLSPRERVGVFKGETRQALSRSCEGSRVTAAVLLDVPGFKSNLWHCVISDSHFHLFTPLFLHLENEDDNKLNIVKSVWEFNNSVN